MNTKYGLSFINDSELFSHVKDTVSKYRFEINLKEFNKNLIDPIKLTFDSKIYGKTIKEIIEAESIRQIDKFYELVTGIPTAFLELCKVIPTVIDDVIFQNKNNGTISSTVFSELLNISSDLIKSIYLLSFKEYEGFSGLEF